MRFWCALVGHTPRIEVGRAICCERCGAFDREACSASPLDRRYYVIERRREARIVIDRTLVRERRRLTATW